MGALVAVLRRDGQKATETAGAMLQAMDRGRAEAFGLASPWTVVTSENLRKLLSVDLNSSIAIGHIFTRTLERDETQPIQLDKASLVFEGRLFPPVSEKVEAEAVATMLRPPRQTSATELVRQMDGDFALVVAESERLIAGRDALGRRPLYYGENASFVALASERKALWRVGIDDPFSFPPASVATINASGFTFILAEAPKHRVSIPDDMESATDKLLTLLQASVKARVEGLDDVAVAFSGGLDSTMVACLAAQAGPQVSLFHASLENQPETAHARQVAEHLGLPIYIHEYNVEDLEQALPALLWIIEEADPAKTSIGLPIYWAAQRAALKKFGVMLSGQGADELFSGYKRYVDAYQTFGSLRVRRMMQQDIAELHATNLERDAKICSACGIELCLPFLARDVVELAVNLPPDMKMEPTSNTLRKLVLRRVAAKLGLPKTVTDRPKKAMQYATGTDRALRRLAKAEHLTVGAYLNREFQRMHRGLVRDA